MTTESTNLIFTIVNGVLLVLNVTALLVLIKEYSGFIRRINDIESGPAKSIMHVHREVIETIQTIKRSASDILGSVEYEKSEIEALLKEVAETKISEVSRSLSAELNNTTLQTQGKIQEQGAKFAEDIRLRYEKMLDRLTSEILISQRAFMEQFTKRKEVIESGLTQYESTRKREIEESIQELVYQVARQCIPDLIPMDTHKKIILDSLQRALDEGKFVFEQHRQV